MRIRIGKKQRALLLHLDLIGPLVMAELSSNDRRGVKSLIRQGKAQLIEVGPGITHVEAIQPGQTLATQPLALPAMPDPTTVLEPDIDEGLIFDTIRDLTGEEETEVFVQTVVDKTLAQLSPANNEHGCYNRAIRNALCALHERGYVVISNGKVGLGSISNAAR